MELSIVKEDYLDHSAKEVIAISGELDSKKISTDDIVNLKT